MRPTSLGIATVLGALIIATALVYHGRQLAEVSRRLEGMEQRTTGLDRRLEEFSSELPSLVEQAGNNAGRQAVHGMVEEAVQMPLNWLRRKPATGASNALSQVSSPAHSSGLTADQGTPWVQFDIRDPVIKIEILPKLKEVSAIPWLPFDGGKQPSLKTNHTGNAVIEAVPITEPK